MREIDCVTPISEKLTKRPYRQVSDKPFPQALHRLAVSRGFTPLALAEAVKKSRGTIYHWYGNRSAPSLNTFGNLLILLEPDDHQLETLAEAYGCLLRKHKRLSQANRTELNTLSLESLINLLQNAQEGLHLSEEETKSLQESIAQEIQKRSKEGRRIYLESPKTVFIDGENITIFSGPQAARTLGISREWIRKLRKKFNLGTILTDSDIEMLKNHLEKTKDMRYTIQEARRK